MSAFDSQAFLQNVSNKPGVYRMLDAAGEMLYVGKAKNLKKRLSNYFRASGLDNKTMALVARIHAIETTITRSETEALLLEQNLIKEQRPPYNIVMRDDKSYPYIFLSSQESYPRLALHRGARKAKGNYYGPFPSASAVRESLAVLQKMFHVRQCEDSFFRNRTRPCLQYQIKRCSGPCVNLITPAAYAEDVRHSVMFIEGHNDEMTRELAARMQQLSDQLKFEEAAVLRDQVRDLRLIQQRQYVDGEKGDVDVLALVESAGIVCIHLMLIRQGRLLGTRNHFPKFTMETLASAQLAAFIGQYYFGTETQFSFPKELICNVMPDDADALVLALSEVAGNKVGLVASVKSHRQKWLDLALTNATQGVQEKLNSRQSVERRFIALNDALQLPQPLARLECFDISHSSGEATVASCVVFDQNGPLKSDYRRFNIEGVTPGDDYSAMKQALTRRFTRLLKGESKLPDLLLIDGGLGQLKQAETVMTELGVGSVLLMGIAKGVSRRLGQETLILGGNHLELALPVESPALHLLQHIRDEAHRFAITAHRLLRSKVRNESALQAIPGIGPKKRKELLQYFGGRQEILRASVEDLARVPGISTQLAELVYAHLHGA